MHGRSAVNIYSTWTGPSHFHRDVLFVMSLHQAGKVSSRPSHFYLIFIKIARGYFIYTECSQASSCCPSKRPVLHDLACRLCAWGIPQEECRALTLYLTHRYSETILLRQLKHDAPAVQITPRCFCEPTPGNSNEDGTRLAPFALKAKNNLNLKSNRQGLIIIGQIESQRSPY